MRKIALVLAILTLIMLPACKKKQIQKPPADLQVTFEPQDLRDAYVTTMKYTWTPTKDFKLTDDYWIFVHFWDVSTKTMYFQDDHKPPVPFSKWETGKSITYSRTFALPEYIEEITKKSFPVDITIGFYNPSTGDKITVFKKRVEIKINPEVVPQIIYSEGWYSEECDKKGRTWRWASKKAVCRVENPKKPLILYLTGYYPAPLLSGQKIRILVNDKVIDEITDPEFKKVYTLDPAILGNGDEFELRFEAEKSFIPKEVYKNSSDTRELAVAITRLFICIK